MDRRQIKLKGGPLDGRVVDPTEGDRIRIVITGRPKHLADRPVAVYVPAGEAGTYRVYVFLEWDRRRRRGKRSKVAA